MNPLFALFATALLAGAGLVVLARNPMTGILGLMLAFLNAAGLMMLYGAEFLGLLLIMVYVGAVTVMFLFVVMTMDFTLPPLRKSLTPALPVGLLTVLAFGAEFATAAHRSGSTLPQIIPNLPETPQNVVALGNVLFTTYALPFQVSGLILLVAMVGAIVLVHTPGANRKRQSVTAQTARRKQQTLVLTHPKTGEGATPEHWAPTPVEKKP